MRDAGFTRQERDIILWLRFLGACFLILGVLFTAKPNYLLQYMDNIGFVFFNFRSAPLENPRYEIWWILSLWLMACLAYASLQAQFDWLRNQHLVPIIIIAKAVSTLGFLSLTLFHPTHFFYIVGAVVDGVICLTTTYAHIKATKSRPF